MRVALEVRAERLAELLDRRRIQRKLARRQQLDGRELRPRALGLGIELADGVHAVAEQVNAIGDLPAHGKEIYQSAAHRELPRLHHLGDAAIRGLCQLPAQALEVQLIARGQDEAMGGDVFPRRQALQQCTRGGEHDPARQRRQPMQHRQALRNDVRVRREDVIRQTLPIRKLPHGDPRISEVETDFIRQLAQRLGVARHHQNRARV